MVNSKYPPHNARLDRDVSNSNIVSKANHISITFPGMLNLDSKWWRKLDNGTKKLVGLAVILTL